MVGRAKPRALMAAPGTRSSRRRATTIGDIHQVSWHRKLVELNCHISISGVITFKNTNELAETIAIIPHDRLLVETDSPYLAPTPFRGKRNESSYIELVAKKIAEVYNVDLDYVNEVTDNNALDIFGN